MKETGDNGELSNELQKTTGLQEQIFEKDTSDNYKFYTANPYITHENTFNLAMEFITQGKPFDAILALEGQLQKNPEA